MTYRTLPEPLHSMMKELSFFYCGEYRFFICERMGIIRFNQAQRVWDMRLGGTVYELDIPETLGHYEVLRVMRDISEKLAYFVYDEMIKRLDGK